MDRRGARESVHPLWGEGLQGRLLKMRIWRYYVVVWQQSRGWGEMLHRRENHGLGAQVLGIVSLLFVEEAVEDVHIGSLAKYGLVL